MVIRTDAVDDNCTLATIWLCCLPLSPGVWWPVKLSKVMYTGVLGPCANFVQGAPLLSGLLMHGMVALYGLLPAALQCGAARVAVILVIHLHTLPDFPRPQRLCAWMVATPHERCRSHQCSNGFFFGFGVGSTELVYGITGVSMFGEGDVVRFLGLSCAVDHDGSHGLGRRHACSGMRTASTAHVGRKAVRLVLCSSLQGCAALHFVWW